MCINRYGKVSYNFYVKNCDKYYDVIKDDELYVKDSNLACTFGKDSKYNYFVHRNLVMKNCNIKEINMSNSFIGNLKYNYVDDKNYDKEIGTNNDLIYQEYSENNRYIVTNKISQHDMSCIPNNSENSREEFVANNNLNVNFKTYSTYNSMIGNIEKGTEDTFDIFKLVDNNDMDNFTKENAYL